MRLVTYRPSDTRDRPRDHLGALIENDTAIVDLHAARAEPAFASMLDLIEAGDDALDGARAIVAAPSRRNTRATRCRGQHGTGRRHAIVGGMQ